MTAGGVDGEQDMSELLALRERLASLDEEMRRSAVAGLAGYPPEQIKELLFVAMGDESWRIRKEALDTLFSGDISDELIDDMVGLLSSSDNAGLRNAACEALEKLGVKSLPALCRAIGDADHDVRKFVVDIMGNIGDASVVPLLIKSLRDEDQNVSAAAAENLGKIADPRAVNELVAVLDRQNIPLCYTVLEALSRIGKPVPLPEVIALASEPLLKKPVIDCLGAVGDIDAIPLLIEGLREKARHVRSAAVTALIRIRSGVPASVAAEHVDPQLRSLASTPLVTELIDWLGESDKNLSEAMAQLLGLIGDPSAALLLLEGCRNESLRRACLQAFRAIGRNGVAALMDAYSAADDEHRCYIAYLCGELGAKESAGTLVMGMHDANHVLRRVATIAAGNIGDKALISELEGLLADEEMDVRVSAVESLGRLAAYDEQAVFAIATRLSKADLAERRRSSATLFAALRDTDRLARLIKDEDSGVRKAAIFALAELRASSSVNHLVMALVDEEPDVRMSAAGALGALGGEQAVQSLLVALKDQNQWVKCAALRSLGALHVAEAEPYIVELIDQSEGLVLIAALRTLQEINSDRAIQLARQALEHSDKEVVKAAVEILSLTDEVWLDDYRDRLLCHDHWDIRSLFIKAFAEHRGKLAIPFLQEALNRETDDLVKRQILDTLDGLS